MDEARCRAHLAASRVGHLATVRPDGRPHVVVCCYAVEGDRDDKPKSGVPLQRVENVRANPQVSLLVDHYEEDWAQLWWVRVDGAAVVLEKGNEEERAIAALTARYPQYAQAPPRGPVIAITRIEVEL